MLNNHNIILLFSDLYNILSFNWLLLMGKSFSYEVNFFLQIALWNSLDPDPVWDFWLDPDPDLIEYGSETLVFSYSVGTHRTSGWIIRPFCCIRYLSAWILYNREKADIRPNIQQALFEQRLDPSYYTLLLQKANMRFFIMMKAIPMFLPLFN